MKCYEHNIDITYLFIMHRLFDSAYRNKIIECLVQYTVPPKLIRLIELTLFSTGSRVKMDSQYTEEFKVESGVKQGDPLSATLYSRVVDVILKQLDVRGNISTRLKQHLVYVDDMLITTRTKQSLIDSFHILKNQSIHFGFIINEQKLNI